MTWVPQLHVANVQLAWAPLKGANDLSLGVVDLGILGRELNLQSAVTDLAPTP